MKTPRYYGICTVILFIIILLAAGCTQQPREIPRAATTLPIIQAVQAPTNQVIIRSARTPTGEILIDAGGMVLYTYANDKAGMSECYDQCAVTWPPVYVDGEIKASSGIQHDISTLTRIDGRKQVTYNGLPLYYYSGDKNPGDMNGDGINGLWALARVASASSTTNAVQESNNRI